MKKNIIGLFVICCILVGCSSNSSKDSSDEKKASNKTTCVLTSDDYSVDYNLIYDDEGIMKDIEITSAQAVEEELTDDMISTAYDSLNSEIKDIEGISIKIKATGDDKKTLSVTTIFDVNKYDFETDAAGVFGGSIDMKNMNYKDVKEMIVSFGATCN